MAVPISTALMHIWLDGRALGIFWRQGVLGKQGVRGGSENADLSGDWERTLRKLAPSRAGQVNVPTRGLNARSVDGALTRLIRHASVART